MTQKKDYFIGMIDLKKYRIHRTDPNNIAIQRRRGKKWRSISYHGNSLNSLISGLFGLIAAQHSPEAENIADALASIKLELVSGIEDIKKMVERDCKDI